VDLSLAVRLIRRLEAEAAIDKAAAKAVAEAIGIPEIEAKAKAAEAKADELREQLNAWYAAEMQGHYALLEAGVNSTPPALPKGLSFTERTKVLVTAPELLPRSALVPKLSLVKAGMPGTVTVTEQHARIAKR
jgi:hypothetical protein